MKHIPFALFALSLTTAIPAAAQDITAATVPTVVTTGRATIDAAPDRAYVIIAAESRAKASADAQRQNAEAMTAVMQKVMAAGITKDAVRTIAYDLQPEFDFPNGRQVLRGYVARNVVEVRVDDLTGVGPLLDAAAGGGATSIGGVRFDLKNRESVEREALRQAVADARARAEAAAAGAGRAIDRIVQIRENGAPEIIRPMMRETAMAAAPAAQMPTPITPSTIQVQATVTLTAALK